MKIEEILKEHEPRKENLLKVLHAIQEGDPGNHVSMEAMKRVARWMKMPLSSVYGVLRYYSMYSTDPRGKHIIRVCNSVVCHMNGADGIHNDLRELILAFPEEDQKLFTIETTECLGHCEVSPVMMVDDKMYGNLDLSGIRSVVTEYQKHHNHE